EKVYHHASRAATMVARRLSFELLLFPVMHHDDFGEIVYDADLRAWTGWCALPGFAECGRAESQANFLSTPTPELGRGQFPLEIRDEDGSGPTLPQANAIRYVREHEADVCRVVLGHLVEACDMKGGPIVWLQERRDSRLWGWLARAVGPEYKTP